MQNRPPARDTSGTANQMCCCPGGSTGPRSHKPLAGPTPAPPGPVKWMCSSVSVCKCVCVCVCVANTGGWGLMRGRCRVSHDYSHLAPCAHKYTFNNTLISPAAWQPPRPPRQTPAPPAPPSQPARHRWRPAAGGRWPRRRAPANTHGWAFQG